MTKKKGFTLIELVAVLVIMAIIALIATPLVLTLVNNSKASANKRSVDAYGKAVELAAMTYLMDNGDYPSDLNSLTVEYTGKEVICNVMNLNDGGSLYLSECSVGGVEVKDKNTEDGWYHYGNQGKSNSSYQAYNVGDQVTYNGIDFYVIAPSDETSDSVTLLKAEPLTVDEVNTYGVGHVNNYVSNSVGTAHNQNGYGGLVYYSSETCTYDSDNDEWLSENCATDYSNSDIKYVVDGWSNALLNQDDLKEDSYGYKARLITAEEIVTHLGYNMPYPGEATFPSENGETPDWVYNENYWYWTMSHPQDNLEYVWYMDEDGDFTDKIVYGVRGDNDNFGVARPVITLLKSAI